MSFLGKMIFNEGGSPLATWLGTLGDGLGFASASTDGKTSDGLGIASGSLGTLSGLGGLLAGVKKIGDGEKWDGGWDIAENAFTTGMGAADVATGAYGIQSANAGSEQEKLDFMKKKGLPRW